HSTLSLSLPYQRWEGQSESQVAKAGTATQVGVAKYTGDLFGNSTSDLLGMENLVASSFAADSQDGFSFVRGGAGKLPRLFANPGAAGLVPGGSGAGGAAPGATGNPSPAGPSLTPPMTVAPEGNGDSNIGVPIPSLVHPVTVRSSSALGGLPADGSDESPPDPPLFLSQNFELVGRNPLLQRGMNAAPAIYDHYIYIGNRTDGSQGHPDPGVLVV